jgi:hypothetical protein
MPATGGGRFRLVALSMNDLKRRRVIRDWVVYGAVAYIAHEEPVETLDMDILVAVSGDKEYFSKVFPALRQLGPLVGEAATFMLHGIPVQVFPATGNALWEDVIRGAVPVMIGDQDAKVASREHLIVLALKAYRPGKDWGRIVQLYAKADRRKLGALIKKFDAGGELRRRLDRLTAG